MKTAVQELPEQAGIELVNWYWRGIRQFVAERFGIELSRSSCLNYLHRLGFVLRRPKKRLVKADEAKREAFVAEYAALSEEAQRTGAKTFFADEAHFRADADPVSGYGAGSAGQVGAEGGAGCGGLDQPTIWGEGQLLFAGMLGDRGGWSGWN